jgi:hypothetical protein
MSNFEVLSIVDKENASEIVAEVFDFITNNMDYHTPFIPNFTFIHKAWLDENPLAAIRVVTSRDDDGKLNRCSMHVISPNPRSMNDEVIKQAITINQSLSEPSVSKIVSVNSDNDKEFNEFVNAVTKKF